MVGATLSHYRVLSLLGRGGMGEVFLAEDLSLGRKVALKVLPPTLAAREDNRQRFEREARAIGALNHPNIVTIYGIEHIDAATVLVMEFVDGQPLADAIPAGGMPLPDLLRVAIPLADAIGVAHRQGIVHRDLKPGNVMVTRDGRVKVLDFGLAKLLDRPVGLSLGSQTTLVAEPDGRTVAATQLGAVIGTVHYMAPEQAQGLAIDHRADIFSLGVVLYEMATGVRPFDGDTAMAVLSSIIREPARPLGDLKPDLPAAFTRLIDRCLEKAPDARPQDALDLRDTLDGVATDLALSGRRGDVSRGAGPSAVDREGIPPGPVSDRVVTPTPAPGTLSTPRSPARLMAGAAALALALCVVAVGWWMVGRSRATSIPITPNRVAIAPFVNRTGDPSLDAVGPMVSASVARLLAREGIDVAHASDTSVARASGPRAPRDAKADFEFARRLGAGLVVSGDLALVGKQFTFQGRIADTETHKDIRQFEPLVLTRGSPADASSRIEQQVTGATLLMVRGGGAGMGFPRQRLAIMELPTYDGYREVTAGLENFGTNMRESARHFEKALEIDPHLWWCLGWLVPAYETLGEFDKAEQIIEKLRPGVGPVGKPVVEYFGARLDGRLVDAYTAGREVLANSPGHLPSATIAAWTARDVGRPRETLDALLPITPAARENAAAWRGWVQTVTQAYHMLGRYDEEREVGVKALETVPGTPLGYLVQARALAAKGRVNDLDKVLESCLTVPPSAQPAPGTILVITAAELRAHGHLAESKAVAEDALRWVEGLDTKLASSVRMQSLRGSALMFLERWRDAKTVYATLAAAAPNDTDARTELGVAAARQGDVAAARDAIEELARMNRPYIRGAHTYGRARVAAALGDRERAVSLLREAFAEGQALAWTPHADLAFEPVRGYAPFEELVAMNKK